MEFIVFLEALFQFSYPDVQYYYGINPLPPYAAFIIAAALFAVVYGFKAAGLFVMAKKQGKTKLLWCAFVPFASTVLMGELAKPIPMGGAKVKHLGWAAAAFELAYTFLGVFLISWHAYFIAEGAYMLSPVSDGTGTLIGYEFDWVNVDAQFLKVLDGINIAAYVLSFVQIIPFVFLNIAFYRSYAPLSYIWMVILCVFFPFVGGFLVFAYRDRPAVDYEGYMRARAEQIRRVQQAQYGPYGPYGGNPYGGQDPYGRQNPYGGQRAPGQGRPADPFGEYGGGQNEPSGTSAPDDPFGEFSSRPSGQGSSSDGEDKKDGQDKKDDPDDFFS